MGWLVPEQFKPLILQAPAFPFTGMLGFLFIVQRILDRATSAKQ